MEDNTEILLDQCSWNDGSLNAVLPAVIDLDKFTGIDVNGVIINLK